MSLQDIMRPNTLPLFINGVGPGPGTQNLTFDTLTQNNGNSSIDLNGNLEAGDLQVNGSADITGSLQANFIQKLHHPNSLVFNFQELKLFLEIFLECKVKLVILMSEY
jgi:hypothetical protein